MGRTFVAQDVGGDCLHEIEALNWSSTESPWQRCFALGSSRLYPSRRFCLHVSWNSKPLFESSRSYEQSRTCRVSHGGAGSRCSHPSRSLSMKLSVNSSVGST